MRVGIIGCGRIALGSHARGYQSVPGVEIAAVADVTPERLALAQRELGLSETDCYQDYRALLERKDVDAVSVTTPQSLRRPIVVAAAEAGKHILSEKPLATIPADADAMIDAARRNHVILAMVHNYLFFPENLAIKRLIEEGAIGAVEFVQLNVLGVEDRPGSAEYQPTWRHDVDAAGGGVLMDMLHSVYLAAYFMGSPIQAASAAVDRRLSPRGNVEDAAYCRFTHPNGYSLVNIAWGVGPGSLEVGGTQGRIVQYNQDFGSTAFATHERLAVFNQQGRTEVEVSTQRRSNAIFADFIASIQEGRPPVAPAEEGKKALEAVLAAYASAATGREVAVPFAVDNPVYRRGARGIAELELAGAGPVREKGIFIG